MKILLVGDYSTVHKTLQEGLVELGHDVVLFSDRDAWKRLDTDIEITIKNYGLGNLGRAYSLWKQYQIVRSLRGFDVVQFINPLIFLQRYKINEFFITTLIKNNRKSFLLAAGDDAYYWSNYKKRFRYSPHDDWIQYDNNGKQPVWNDPDIIKWNKALVNKVNGVIPIMYEYANGYKDVSKLLNIIPIPVNLNKISYKKNTVDKKIIIYHGITRSGCKGTRYIKSAMERLKKDYPDEVEIIFDGRMPYKKYLKLMETVNINIDQSMSYSYGVNSVISLAMGKVTLGGCEPECLKAFNLNDSPIINIIPDEDDIYNKLVTLIHDKDSLLNIGVLSREYAEKLHGHIGIAKKYLSTWESA